jgi:hypothetical protein
MMTSARVRTVKEGFGASSVLAKTPEAARATTEIATLRIMDEGAGKRNEESRKRR